MTTTIRTLETIIEGPFGVELLVKGEDTDGRFALVEHPIAARALAGPMHVHEHEDEYSYVLEGEVGFQVDDDVFTAGPGQLVAKPRRIWHGFWNAGDAPARVLELISPGGFANYFAELAPLLQPERDIAGIARLQAKYGLEMDFSSIERLSREHGLGSP
jgi:quercetin dioxygenase-like cupin family protein